ncbi:ribonuclease III [bacterium]|nr:ribonuclease III [bacterium]
MKHGLERLAPDDLDWSLTHRSFSFEAGLARDNERLEFLGDAVLSALSAEFLYEKHPDAPEGILTKRRARMVSRASMGRHAIAMGIGEIILLGQGERDTGGAHRLSVLGSALEAIIGIIFLKLGYDACREFVRRHVLEALAADRADEPAAGDYKSALQEFTQQHFKQVPVYKRLGEEGPPHERRFMVGVELEGRELARGAGARIKEAQNEAARLALDILQRESA